MTDDPASRDDSWEHPTPPDVIRIASRRAAAVYAGGPEDEMRRLALGLLVALSLAACSKPADPTPELRAENASLRQEVVALEKRVSGLEKQNAAMENRLAVAEERLRDVAGVMDKAMVRLDRVDR